MANIKRNCGVCKELKVEKRGRLVCMNCQRKLQLKYYHEKPKIALNEKQKNAKYKNRKKIRASGLTNQKVYAMKHRYGISESQFIEIYTSQNGLCAICEKHITKKDSLIDHCHNTKFIRGLLCRKCNFAIGLLGDNKRSISNAIQYLSNDFKIKIA